MLEASIMAGFFLAGVGPALWLRPAAHPLTCLVLALPLGVGLYLSLGWLLLVVGAPFAPVALIVGLIASSVAIALVAWPRASLLPAVTVLGVLAGAALVGAASFLLQSLPLTRITPDSIRYVISAGIIGEFGDLGAVPLFDLVHRQVMEGVFYSPSVLAGKTFLPSLMPLFGLTGIGSALLLADEWVRRCGVPLGLRVVLAGAAATALLSMNRVIFNLFYIHGHMIFGVFFGIAVAASWLTVVTRESRWAVLVPPALVILVATRAEGFLVAALLLVPIIASSRMPGPVRWSAVGATAGAMFLWFGSVVRPHVVVDGFNHADGALLAAVALVLFTAGTHLAVVRPWYRFAPPLLVAGLFAALSVAIALDPSLMADTFSASWENVKGAGAWNLTWLVLPTVAAVALVTTRLPDHAIWWTPLIGFVPLTLLLAFLRGSAYRVGPGDSGNRVLMHILLVVMSYLLIAAAAGFERWREAHGIEPVTAQS